MYNESIGGLSMRRKKKKLKFRRIILLLILGLTFYCLTKYDSLFENYFSKHASVIHQTQNKNYAGIGQKEVKNEDGYFTTFTTEEIYPKTYIEYKQNGTASWSEKSYWGGTMRENGCGITALSIILSAYGKNVTPEDLRQKYYPVLNAEQIPNELSIGFGIQNSGFYFDRVHLSDNSIIEHLQTNRPILICVWNQPHKNRWTEKSHYMVLLATDSHEKVYVSNPNGGKNDSKSSGWYKISEITPYIAKALYIESYE